MPGIRSRADVVFGPARVAVYIDGCFWHGCPLHGSVPSSNANFWKRKFEENRRRDAETKAKLEQRGWMVLRFWEHDDPGIAADKVLRLVRSRSGSRGQRAPETLL